MLSIQPLDAACGAQVRGVDLARDLSDELMRSLTQALYAHRVLIIKNQRLEKADYYRFGEQWGQPIAHVLDHMRMQDFPAMMTIGNTEERDKDDTVRNGAALWHTDQSYEAVPASATMLYSVVVPRVGGQTHFADMASAYDALDDETKSLADQMTVGHLYGQTRLRDDEYAVTPLKGDRQAAAVPTCWHPLVRAHPVTGRRALYAVGHGAFRIRGMDDYSAASDFLFRMKEHCVQPRFVYAHSYEVGDVCIFDTLSTMHRASPIGLPSSLADDRARLLWRISVRGLPGVYRNAQS
jgi:alpha-ketoglutarate-dependent taurine dioxygenase